MKRLLEAGLTAKPEKCRLAMGEVEYRGYRVGGGQVRPTDEKVQAVRNSPRPVTKKDVPRFLGLTGYYRKFIPSYEAIAAPLSDLTKKRQPTELEWTGNCQEAFDQLKSMFCAEPILANPDYYLPFILHTDASERGLRAELFQIVSGGRKTAA